MNTEIKKILRALPLADRLRLWKMQRDRFQAFRADFARFTELSAAHPARFSVEWEDRKPCLEDNTEFTSFDAHYVFHPAWAARIVAATRPAKHVDISSSLHFCTMLSAFTPVEFYDYRPAELNLSGLTSARGDLMELPFPDQSVSSISCMHVVEHIGLGRYGEPLDPAGDLKAMAELQRVVAPGGSLLFVTPVGKPRVVFNAHRIYSTRQVLKSFSELRLAEFALVPDWPRCELVRNAPLELADSQSYGCGCFWFQRDE
ncbi:MAG: DUF268 domain-containing protein [Verrucomicrobiota bacterium]